MKNSYIKILSTIFLIAIAITGCKDDIISISIGETRNLIAQINTQSAVFGDNIIYTVAIDQTNDSLSMQEDIDVKLTFTGKGNDGNEVKAEDVFENFPAMIPLHKGDKKAFGEFKVKNNVKNFPISGTITSYSRGYQIASAERPITISNKHYSYITIKNNSDNTIKEGGNFILVLNIGNKAKEDVNVNIIATKNADKLIGLPKSLTVKAGFKTVESDIIKVIAEQGKNSFSNIPLSFSTESTLHPLISDNLALKITDMDAGLTPGTELTNERWVYSDPDQIFVSKENKNSVMKWDATKSMLEIKEGDPHPNPTLAAKGWTFLNSYEFHPIDELTQGGGADKVWGTRVPRFMAAQNVSNTQKVQSVVNEKYSTMTNDGYLKMWCAHDPGLPKTGEATGTTDYGVSALYASKFDGVPTGADSWESSNVRILPGTRVEVRVRVRGEKHSFNAAIWFQGNIRNVQWASYGEVDLLENPANKKGGSVGGVNNAWQTFHWDKEETPNKDEFKPTTGGLHFDNMDEFYIYWMEWTSNDEIALGINGKENIRIKADGTRIPSSIGGGKPWTSSTHWPFKDTYNPEGMHLLLTFAGCNEWALDGKPSDDWANGFKDISYEDSKTNDRTPRIEIDWIRFYKTSNYKYKGNGAPTRNKPMY